MARDPHVLVRSAVRGTGPDKRNVLDRRAVREYFAFLFQNEDANNADGPWLLRFEALSAPWFLRTWEVFRSEYRGAELEASLDSLTSGKPFADAWRSLPDDVAALLYETHRRYMGRIVLAADPAPVSLLELMVGSDQLAPSDVVDGEWYSIEIGDGQALDPLRNAKAPGEAVYTSVGVSPELDARPTVHPLHSIRRLSKVSQTIDNVLRSLHFPQPERGEKEEPEPEPTPPPSPDAATGADTVDAIEAMLKRNRAPSGDPRPAKQRKVQAPPFVPVIPLLPPPPVPMVIVLPPPPPANRMMFAGGGSQPLVGVNPIGQGNNISLWDRAESIIAYVDFGAPTMMNLDTHPGANPTCVCSDPMIILSHWDWDHYAMVRWEPAALRRRWIAPQQLFGALAARELYARLLVETANGGDLHLWTAPAGHVFSDFGFIERGNGPPVNDDGLIVYVRVDDDPAIIPAATLPGAFGPRPLPPPLGPGMLPGLVLSQPVIVGGLAGEPIPWQIAPPFLPMMVVVPAGAAPAFAAPGMPTAAGTAAMLPGAGGPVAALWIPPAGVAYPPAPGFAGGNFVPTGGAGGWAISPADYVSEGGVMIDFPSPGTGLAHTQGRMVVSPTPGTAWVPPNYPGAPMPPGLPPPGYVQVPAAGLVAGGGMWQPVWGGGLGPCWEVPLPAAAAVALAPLPAGPPALVVAGGAAAITANERYVLLPGDCGFQFIPSQAPWQAVLAGGGGVPPHVVGLVATHHGSDSWIPPVGAAAAIQHIPAAAGFVLANNPLAAAAPACDKIAYSYGVRHGVANFGQHCYVNAGGAGHPRPAAIAAFAGNGWGVGGAGNGTTLRLGGATPDFNRLNTAPDDYQSAQAYDPIPIGAVAQAGAHALGHLNLDIALGWDAVAGGPIAGDHSPNPLQPAPGLGVDPPILRTCATCGRQSFFVY